MPEVNTERVMVFIDGSNFYHGLKATINTAAIRFPQLVQHLAGPSRKLVRTYYYNAPIPQGEDPERYKAQQRFFASLKRIPSFEVRLGRLEKRRVGLDRAGLVADIGKDCAEKFIRAYGEAINTYAEKGIDIQIAVDMLQLAFNKAYDTAILVSGDGDFASVVQAVKGFGRRVEVAYVSGRPAYHLRQVCDVFVELSVDLLRSLTLSQKQNLHE